MIERYWGNSDPDSGKCQCGLKGNCRPSAAVEPTRYGCMCDYGLASLDVYDDGFLRDKERLPVTQLRFGDTGNLGDDKHGKHLLGPLRCLGDSELEFCYRYM